MKVEMRLKKQEGERMGIGIEKNMVKYMIYLYQNVFIKPITIHN